MKSKDLIIDYFNSLPEVKRIHELEPYIDNNLEIKNQFDDLKKKQRLMVLKKEKNLDYQKELNDYNLAKEKLLDMPFVEEYLELIDYIHNLLDDLTNGIEDEIYKCVNK